MASKLIDLNPYAKNYGLTDDKIALTEVTPPIDINRQGLIMHGSQVDPHMILKYGLAPQQTKTNSIDTDWQICLGLSSKDPHATLDKQLSRKNSAVKYAGYFSPNGMIYILNDEVKNMRGYTEFWDQGSEHRGYAWVTQPILSNLIDAVITTNMALAAAAMLAAQVDKLIYTPDGACYKMKL